VNDIIFLAISGFIMCITTFFLVRPLIINRASIAETDFKKRLETLREAYQNAVDEDDRLRLLNELRMLEESIGQNTIKASRKTGYIVLIILPVASVITYIIFGMPSVAMFDPEDALSSDAKRMIEAVEERLVENPQDARGWDALGQTYLGTSQPEKAIDAFTRALDIEETPERLMNLAEARFIASGLNKDPEAIAIMANLFQNGMNDFRLRYYLGIQAIRDREMGAARALLRDMFVQENSSAPWFGGALSRLDAELQRMGADREDIGVRPLVNGPTQDDINAAQSMTPSEQRAMIEGMVAQLAGRLNDNPTDVSGWVRLIRAYGVLGQFDDAQNAIKTAMENNPNDPQILILAASEQKRRLGSLDAQTEEKLQILLGQLPAQSNLRQAVDKLLKP